MKNVIAKKIAIVKNNIFKKVKEINMSKLKAAQLDDATLNTAVKLLEKVNETIDNIDFNNVEDVKRLRLLVSTYINLKPYF